MLQDGLQNTVIDTEFTQEQKKEWFNLSRQKVIYNVDTLYYTVKLEDSTNLQYIQLIEYITEKQKFVDDTQEGFLKIDILGIDEGLITRGFGFGMYKRDIQVEHFFSCFIADKVPNRKTPELFIQIRSEYLWLYGDVKAFSDSYKVVEKFLNHFGLKIFKADLNRLDLAHHTNLIQSPTKYFSTDKLGKIQVSNYKRAHVEGYFEGEEFETDYITLGLRKSNNHFFRCYLKNQEVCNMGYKQFFLQLWEREKLISKYDKFCLELCFVQGNYNFLNKARLIFYLTDGANEEVKDWINEVIASSNQDEIRILADMLLPPVTKILNVEFQTKRKYLSSIKIYEPTKLDGNCYLSETKGVLQYLVNVNKLHEDLTTNVLRFIDISDNKKHKKDKKVAYWWTKIQKVNLRKKFNNCEVLISREYQKGLDVQRIKKGVTSKLASLSVYQKHVNNSFNDDVTEYISWINENDLELYSQKKIEKATLLKKRLCGIEPIEIENRYMLIDLQTGECLA